MPMIMCSACKPGHREVDRKEELRLLGVAVVGEVRAGHQAFMKLVRVLVRS